MHICLARQKCNMKKEKQQKKKKIGKRNLWANTKGFPAFQHVGNLLAQYPAPFYAAAPSLPSPSHTDTLFRNTIQHRLCQASWSIFFDFSFFFLPAEVGTQVKGQGWGGWRYSTVQSRRFRD